MKPLVFFLLFCISFGFSACEKELKEHKVPGAMKKELAKMKKKQTPEALAKEIQGTIRVDPDHILDQPSEPTLFVFARAEGQTSGPPLAVKRFEVFRLPFEFTIGPADTMMEGVPFEGTLSLTARLDQDGSAMSGPGDLEGSATVKVGEKKAELVLDTLIAPDPTQQVAGAIALSEALKAKAPKGASLFIIARKKGAGGGPPLAVKRLASPKFPMAFTIGQTDTMVPGSVFEGEIELQARLDQDGSVRSAPGDIEGRIEVIAGDANVQLTLNTLVE